MKTSAFCLRWAKSESLDVGLGIWIFHFPGWFWDSVKVVNTDLHANGSKSCICSKNLFWEPDLYLPLVISYNWDTVSQRDLFISPPDSQHTHTHTNTQTYTLLPPWSVLLLLKSNANQPPQHYVNHSDLITKSFNSIFSYPLLSCWITHLFHWFP